MLGGPGAVRVLLLDVPGESPVRDRVRRLANALGARAPHVLWLVILGEPDGANAGIVAWSGSGRGRRVASLLWEPARVLPSDAETLCALAGCAAEDDAMLHTRWLEVLGREALTRRFYGALEHHVGALADALPAGVAREDARAVSLLYSSRLLFLCFLEAKGWLDGDRGFLGARFDACMQSGGGFHRRVLLPLFFGTLNTPPRRRATSALGFGRVPFLNGGLFARTPLERRIAVATDTRRPRSSVGSVRAWFSDERLGALLTEVFQRFRFVAREDSTAWSEAAVDPEMLGRAFECLMVPAERRAGGAFYTPQALVARVADAGLDAADPGALATLDALRQLRVLDPACGSGAFLVYALERLADRRRALGDPADIATIRRDVLTRSVFGVDRDPTAVWLCELRLWLSVVIESAETDPLRVTPLPNLDRNIRVGDALAGSAFDGEWRITGGRQVVAMRQRYARATGSRKRTLARALDREERRRAIAQLDREIESARHARQECLASQRGRDLFGERIAASTESRAEARRLRDALRAFRSDRRRLADGGALPFSFTACFADVHAAGGFHVVIGNPPWVRLHRIPEALRQQLRRGYAVFRGAAWEAGAATARASTGFASQVDLAALFVERSLALAQARGIVSLLLPAKLWHSLAAGGVRRLLRQHTLLRLEDYSDSRHSFDAAVYPSLLVARKATGEEPLVDVAVHARDDARTWRAPMNALTYDDSPGAPWLMLPPSARAAFDRVRDAGAALAESHLGPPRLGVKSGCNAAFLVRVQDATTSIATIVGADGEAGKVELALLRPALRGDAVTPWIRRPCDEWILWTHDERGPLVALPERARGWLRRYYGELVGRSDAARSRRWWSLFRTDAADTSQSRVVWADFGRRPRALVLAPHDPVVPLNTCYVIRCQDPVDASALSALLNSRVAAAWLNALAEPARGGFRRYLGWTVSQLPIPHDWARGRAILAAAEQECRSVWASDPAAADDRLTSCVIEAFGLRLRDVESLLADAP